MIKLTVMIVFKPLNQKKSVKSVKLQLVPYNSLKNKKSHHQWNLWNEGLKYKKQIFNYLLIVYA